MKVYKFSISEVYIRKFFKPIRSKAEVIEILMETIRYMKLNLTIKEQDVCGSITLKIDKMNRLFFFSDKKYFSIVFPFFVKKEYENYLFSFKNNIEVDSRLISQVISIIQCNDFNAPCSLDFVAPILEYEEKYDENFWVFLRELLLMEDGYIRYDYDKENYEKHKNIGEECKHPLNHYDLFYSSYATFKIGLHNKLSEDDFINLLNTKTDCKYLI